VSKFEIGKDEFEMSKSDEKKKFILEKARQVFIRKGFNNVTMKDIIDECQISRGGLYFYFSSIDEIFKAVVEVHNKSRIDTVKSDIEKGIAFSVLLESYFLNQKRRFLNMDKSLKTAMMEFFLSHKDEYSKSFILSQFTNSKNILLEILKYGVNNNEVEDIDLMLMAENIMFFFEGIGTLALIAGINEEHIDRQFEHIKKNIITNIESIGKIGVDK